MRHFLGEARATRRASTQHEPLSGGEPYPIVRRTRAEVLDLYTQARVIYEEDRVGVSVVRSDGHVVCGVPQGLCLHVHKAGDAWFELSLWPLDPSAPSYHVDSRHVDSLERVEPER